MSHRDRLVRLIDFLDEIIADTRDALGSQPAMPADHLVATLDEIEERLSDERLALARQAQRRSSTLGSPAAE